MAKTETAPFEDLTAPINDYSSVSIHLASPEKISEWSFGEVKKPETINYRTYRPEKDGLFCERIFGPEKDWECACGKYRGIKHKDIVCDRCGVKVTMSKVRRERMGHISLAAPVVHIWFFKAIPSKLALLLGMKTSDLEMVVYFQNYLVTDVDQEKGVMHPGFEKPVPLNEGDVLTEAQYRKALETYGQWAFKADMGAEAVRRLIRKQNLEEITVSLREQIAESRAKQTTENLIKRLRLIEEVKTSGNDPSWMILDKVPVIPPDLRPLVFLESGNFATSDLNDLYRRVINRNNRLKKLIELRAPVVIIRNEKRMLQQAVDALFDNNRSKRPVLGSNNRPLKSLTDMIKGKQGRFRENLLGKRVDYSGRSVIVVGPELKLHQCGLPKKIALELFQPFIIRRLKEQGLVDTIKSAKKMLERRDEEVWDVLDEVIHDHPVMLNRAPTLHRMGIQAFQPVLIEGNAIRLHPLACAGFNADFDGDTMSVHLPLSMEAQIEAHSLMLSTNNVFSPANGKPIMGPTQDMVLGCYYFSQIHTHLAPEEKDRKRFFDVMEAFAAYGSGKIKLLEPIEVRLAEDKLYVNERGKQVSHENKRIVTSMGRIIFNDMLAPDMPFYNFAMTKNNLNRIIEDCYKTHDRIVTIELLDNIKDTGFKAATLSGVSIGAVDLKVPEEKWKIINETQKKVDQTYNNYLAGAITDGERYNRTIDLWTHAREEVWDKTMRSLRDDVRKGIPYVNPIQIMVDGGAKGGIQQVGQLAGMRGLMANPSGKIIEAPIKANFREGLGVLEYFSSTHGSRKGLADTALKTADSGYLTRKLADVVQNIVITMHDCGTLGSVEKAESGGVSLWKKLFGRTSRDTIRDPETRKPIIRENEIFTEAAAMRVENLTDRIRVRSPMTCESPMGICALCYGADLSRPDLYHHEDGTPFHKFAEMGTATGIIAAQSIGEPGTQLTMRTFHIGGLGQREVEQSSMHTLHTGKVQFGGELRTVESEKGETMVLNRRGIINIVDDKDLLLESHAIPAGSVLKVQAGDAVKAPQGKSDKGSLLCEWDPHSIPIISEYSGKVRWVDIKQGVTMRLQKEKGGVRRVIMEHRGNLHPRIELLDNADHVLVSYTVPEKAFLELKNGARVHKGDIIAKTPRAEGGVADITGGLPRITDLFETRRPKDPGVMSEIEGRVAILKEMKRGKRILTVSNDKGETTEHPIPRGKHIVVHDGEWVYAGDKLVEGPDAPQDILRIKGERAVQHFLISEIQKVYLAQGVGINDKHIEIIISQMMKRVEVTEPGDSEFLPGEIVDRHRFAAENIRLQEKKSKGEKVKPAKSEPLLMGVTKAALRSDSFLSAASFQDTTKVLSEAALYGRIDNLQGLKENVILGHIVPAGTGFGDYHERSIETNLTKAELEALQARLAAANTREEEEEDPVLLEKKS